MDNQAPRPEEIMPADLQQLGWDWRIFSSLSGLEVYQLLRLRQQVFIVEQDCPYLDADDLDRDALHLLCWQVDGQRKLLGCLRLLPPGVRFPTPAIGRLATDPMARGKGIGRQLMVQALHRAGRIYQGEPVMISAQRYLERFYLSFGFTICSEPYDEDGIPHIDMRYNARH